MILDLLAEDAAHERFLRPLIGRLAREADVRVQVRVRAARGGHPRVMQELDLYQRAIAQGVAGRPDLLVVAIDSNCAPYTRARRDIERGIRPEFRGITVIACPDPHVERWYLADPPSFGQVVGKQPRGGKRKCGRDLYKRRLAEAVATAGHPVLLGGIEFAEELVASMDLYRAGKTERSLKRFLDDLRARLTMHR